MTTKTEKLPTEDPTLTRAIAFAKETEVLVIDSPQKAEIAQQWMKDLAAMYKAAEAILQPPVDFAHTAWKQNVAHRDKYLRFIETAKKSMSSKVGEWLAAEQQKAEAARRAEEDRLRAEAAAKQKAEAEAAEAKAVALAKAGLTEQAEAALEEAVELEQAPPAPVYVPPVEVPRAKGITTTTTWDFEIQDVTKIPREFMVPNEVMIRKFGQSMKGAGVIPGVRFFAKHGVSTRA